MLLLALAFISSFHTPGANKRDRQVERVLSNLAALLFELLWVSTEQKISQLPPGVRSCREYTTRLTARWVGELVGKGKDRLGMMGKDITLFTFRHSNLICFHHLFFQRELFSETDMPENQNTPTPKHCLPENEDCKILEIPLQQLCYLPLHH